MQYPDIELGQRGYEANHIARVTAAIGDHFGDYFRSAFPDRESTSASFESAITEWAKEKDAYEALLDLELLEEYSYDANAFKSSLRKDCPIIRRCLMSPIEEMKDYKKQFGMKPGQELLAVTTNLARFVGDYMLSFDGEQHERCMCPADLRLSALLEADYTAFGVIGGGIKSHFLYKLHPEAFSNRSQGAIWALYYLTGNDDFGFHDGSEFLMARVEHDRNSIYQNYHYPYDLFAFYALQVFLMLKAACAEQGVAPDPYYRYVYVDAFLDSITNAHQDEIQILKGKEQYDFFG